MSNPDLRSSGLKAVASGSLKWSAHFMLKQARDSSGFPENIPLGRLSRNSHGSYGKLWRPAEHGWPFIDCVFVLEDVAGSNGEVNTSRGSPKSTSVGHN